MGLKDMKGLIEGEIIHWSDGSPTGLLDTFKKLSSICAPLLLSSLSQFLLLYIICSDAMCLVRGKEERDAGNLKETSQRSADL